MYLRHSQLRWWRRLDICTRRFIFSVATFIRRCELMDRQVPATKTYCKPQYPYLFAMCYFFYVTANCSGVCTNRFIFSVATLIKRCELKDRQVPVTKTYGRPQYPSREPMKIQCEHLRNGPIRLFMGSGGSLRYAISASSRSTAVEFKCLLSSRSWELFFDDPLYNA